MRFNPNSSGSLALLVSLFFSNTGLGENPSGEEPSRFVVTVTEYRAKLNPSPDASSGEIIARLRDGETKPIRTIRVPAIDERPTVCRSGERVGFSTASSDAESEKGELEFVETGTMLHFTAKRTASTVLMEFDYTTSFLEKQKDAGSPPTISEVTVQGTYVFSFGKPVLISGLTGTDEFYLIATVDEPVSDSEPKASPESGQAGRRDGFSFAAPLFERDGASRR